MGALRGIVGDVYAAHSARRESTPERPRGDAVPTWDHGLDARPSAGTGLERLDAIKYASQDFFGYGSKMSTEGSKKSLDDFYADLEADLEQYKGDTVTIKFSKDRFHSFYVDDPDSDMDDVYHAFDRLFGARKWSIQGRSMEAIEALIVRHVWPFDSHGDYLIQRWINEGMAVLVDSKTQ